MITFMSSLFVMSFLGAEVEELYGPSAVVCILRRKGRRKGCTLTEMNAGLGIGLPPIIKFGTEFLRKKVVPECLSGRKTICLAITEPYAGSDVASIRTEARESDDGDHYIVNGEKKW
jgi:alkylation response protein AidB-like acyl-CoA dehydrogenase